MKALLNFAKTTIIGGFFIVLPVAILLILALCFVTGLLVRTRLGRLAGSWVEGSGSPGSRPLSGRL